MPISSMVTTKLYMSHGYPRSLDRESWLCYISRELSAWTDTWCSILVDGLLKVITWSRCSW